MGAGPITVRVFGTRWRAGCSPRIGFGPTVRVAKEFWRKRGVLKGSRTPHDFVSSVHHVMMKKVGQAEVWSKSQTNVFCCTSWMGETGLAFGCSLLAWSA